MVLQRSVKSEHKFSRKFSIILQSSFEATPEDYVESVINTSWENPGVQL